MATTLSDYITETRRLLHDATGNFYTDEQLTDYINDARQRLVRDTGCLRKYQTTTANLNQEVYDYSVDLPEGDRTLDIVNINLIWGNTRIPMRQMSWTQFNAELRFWQNYVGRPIAFAPYSQKSFYIAPVPDQEYGMELDTIVMPIELTTGSQVDEIAEPYNTPIAFYAAYKAKYYEQSYGEAEIFKQEYTKQAQAVLTSVFTRRMPNPYSTPY